MLDTHVRFKSIVSKQLKIVKSFLELFDSPSCTKDYSVKPHPSLLLSDTGFVFSAGTLSLVKPSYSAVMN